MRGSLDFVRVPNSSPGPYGGQICPFISSGDDPHLSPRKSSGSRHELPADALTAKQRVPTAISLLIKVFMSYSSSLQSSSSVILALCRRPWTGWIRILAGFIVLCHFVYDFLNRFDLGYPVHTKTLKVGGQGAHHRPFVSVQLARALGFSLAFALFRMTASIAWLKLTSSATSLGRVSVKTLSA